MPLGLAQGVWARAPFPRRPPRSPTPRYPPLAPAQLRANSLAEVVRCADKVVGTVDAAAVAATLGRNAPEGDEGAAKALKEAKEKRSTLTDALRRKVRHRAATFPALHGVRRTPPLRYAGGCAGQPSAGDGGGGGRQGCGRRRVAGALCPRRARGHSPALPARDSLRRVRCGAGTVGALGEGRRRCCAVRKALAPRRLRTSPRHGVGGAEGLRKGDGPRGWERV